MCWFISCCLAQLNPALLSLGLTPHLNLVALMALLLSSEFVIWSVGQSIATVFANVLAVAIDVAVITLILSPELTWKFRHFTNRIAGRLLLSSGA